MADNALTKAEARQNVGWLRSGWESYRNANWGWHIAVPSGLGAVAFGVLGWGWTLLSQGEYGAAMLIVLLFWLIGTGAALAIPKRGFKWAAVVVVIGIAIYSAAVVWSAKGDKPWTTLFSSENKSATSSTPSPSPTPTSTPSTTFKVYDEFQPVYKLNKDDLGDPVADCEMIESTYFALHKNAKIIWDQTEFYRLAIGVAPTRWSTYPDINTSECKWYDDDYLRKRFKPEKGYDGPWAGVARGWDREPAAWSWIGGRDWHCIYLNRITHKQKFQRGFIIGPYITYPEDRNYLECFVLFDDGTWTSKVTFKEGGAPVCDKPIPDPNCIK